MRKRILIADDHQIVREGLKSLINNQGDLEVVAEASNGREAMELARKHRPDLVIMDISMPEVNGIEATMEIKQELPEVRVIVLSMHSDRRFVDRDLKAGASGYILKDCAFDELLFAIKATVNNQIYLSPTITNVVVESFLRKSSQPSESSLNLLTEREKEILQQIADGKNTKQIAYDLNLSVKTVETHRLNIMNKLKIYNLADLIKFALREGLTSLD